jgi:hypothetical protein
MRRRIPLRSPSRSTANATPAMTEKVTAAFDGGRLTSGGVMLLAMVERRLGLAHNLAPGVRIDAIRRGSCTALSICSSLACRDLLRLRGRRRPRSSAVRSGIQAGLRTAAGQRSRPILSRLKNAPRLRDVIRLTYTLVDTWMES